MRVTGAVRAVVERTPGLTSCNMYRSRWLACTKSALTAMLPASCFSRPILAWCAYGRWRSGLSNRTVPVFFVVVPAGNCCASSARFTTGPLTRNGSVGKRPCDGPGSMLLAGKLTRNDVDVSPDDAIGVKFEYAVFWKYNPYPPRTIAVPA